MAGVHTLYRTTSKATGAGRYVAIGGSLQLPTAFQSRKNMSDSIALNGAYPEFIYGFYPANGKKGFDAGVIAKEDGKFYLFVADNSTDPNSPFDGTWYDTTSKGTGTGPINAAKGSIITLNCYFVNGYVKLDAKSGNTVLDSISVHIKNDTHYKAFLAGCNINREVVIAINPDQSGVTNLTPVVYFENVKFYNSTMTTASGDYIKMANSNTREWHWYDGGFPEGKGYDYKRTVGIETNGYTSDSGSATTDKTSHSIN